MIQESTNSSRNSSFSGAEKFEDLAQEFDSFFVWNPDKQQWSINADWDQLGDSVLEWFQKKGVEEGKPSIIHDNHYQTKKKAIVLKRALTVNKPLMERLQGKKDSLRLSV